MITEDYVSFETAKLLKAKRADFDTDNVYTSMGRRWEVNMKKFNYAEYDVSGYVKRPTLQMAMKWLRDEKNIHIKVHCSGNRNYLVYAQSLVTAFNDFCIESATCSFNTYEEACEVAIKYCLENLI